MTNRLIDSNSPYLRQHADNPVDWYPWGPEALARARKENRPILLSIGYAACHWCHVMAHESFEDPETAALMNRLFVNIKVDREERPDLDAIYMRAVQAMTGQGGWPMTVALTPDGHPFFGGTYFPPEDRHGLPAFRRVLQAIASAYHERPQDVAQATSALKAMYAEQLEAAAPCGPLAPAFLEQAFRQVQANHDLRHGGFGGAPKFPQAPALDFALRHWRRSGEAAALALARDSFLAMARGGIHDQVGGGFHRYSVDAAWQVPHFEKMLYDNALLLQLGVHLWQATADAEIRQVVELGLQWLQREMTSADGGFYSSIDADSDGEEGRFYLWSASEIDALLGQDATLLRAYWGVSEQGNFEGRNILHLTQSPAASAHQLGVDAARLREALQRARGILCQARETRVKPARDDKIVAGWNGLMLRTLAQAARALNDSRYGDMARRNAERLLREHVRDGRVLRIAGRQPIQGFLEDHAAVALGLLALYELDFDERWRRAAEQIGASMLHWFRDEQSGLFFDTASDAERLITRPRELMDNPTPSGTALAVELLLRLATLQQDEGLRQQAIHVLESFATTAGAHGMAFGHLLGCADLAIHGTTEVALIGTTDGEALQALAAELGRHYLPELVLAAGEPRQGGEVALLADRPSLDGVATAYVCKRYVCDAPTTDARELARQLDRIASPC